VKHLTTSTITLCSTVLVLSGCTGTEAVPNNATQTGVVTGAVAGSVIGYNAGSHRGSDAVLGAVAGAAVGGLIGNAVDENNPEPVNTGGWHE
jgi:uncharacterized protein YcfJ